MCTWYDTGGERRTQGMTEIRCDFSRCLNNRDGICTAKHIKVSVLRTEDVFYDLYPCCKNAMAVDA